MLSGGKGNDVLTIDHLDTVNGGVGTDAAVVSGATAAINLNLVSAGLEVVNANSSTFANVSTRREPRGL